MSKNGIVTRLTETGIPSPAAYKRQNGMNYNSPKLRGDSLWSVQAIAQMLANQMYVGNMVQGRQKVKSYKVHTRVSIPKDEWIVVEDTHEPIIEAELFAQAQILLQKDTRTAPKSGQLYTFSGFLRCADCDKAMARRPSKNDRVYYACRTYTTSSTLCSKHSMRHDKLEGMVLAALQQQIDLVEGLAELIDEINCAPVIRTVSKRLDSSLKQRRQELQRMGGIRTGLFMDWKNGDITREEYHSLKQELEEREQRLKQDIARLEEETRDMAQGISSSDPYFETFRKHRKITALNRGIVSELIKVIHIHENGDVDIEFNFEDQHRRTVEFIESSQRADLVLVDGRKAG